MGRRRRGASGRRDRPHTHPRHRTDRLLELTLRAERKNSATVTVYRDGVERYLAWRSEQVCQAYAVAGDERWRWLDRHVAVGGVDVGVTEPAGLHPDEYLTRAGLRYGTVLDLQR